MRAFRDLVERYEGCVAATATGMLGPGPDAEDVGQETFIRFHKAIHSFRGEASLKTYLTRIAINQSIRALRRRTNRRKRFVGDEYVVLNEPTLDGGRVIDQRERRKLVHEALEHLRPNHRAVVVLRMLEGYSTKETAELLGIAPGTVMSRLSRAMTSLRSTLGPLVAD